MFRPDLLTVFREYLQRCFQLRIFSCGYNCCVYNYWSY